MTDTLHDIVDTAVAVGSCTTLVATVTEAGLVDTLKTAGSFTVFAPSDAGFAALLIGIVKNLVKAKNKLTAILLLHVLSSKILAAYVAGKGIEPATAGGASVYVDGTHGVIYVIDAVILLKG
jgi:uncharacterized surface protein with fasciclin (FAS1) repeats